VSDLYDIPSNLAHISAGNNKSRSKNMPSPAHLSRRTFLSTTAAATVADLVAGSQLSAEPVNSAATELAHEAPIFISTWDFGRIANEKAMATLAAGGDMLDAIEQGIRETEIDPDNHSVGFGGTPNADGVVQLDACIMNHLYNAGSVAAIEDILHPISVARMVMERTKHVMLAGAGAKKFALEQGMEATDTLTEERRQKWQEWLKTQEEMSLEESHDTIALVGCGPDGTLSGGCSTSGWGYKLAGRIGDSPIIGSGLYVDGQVGAAGATGLGENVMRYCGSFMVVDYLSRGASPEEACIETVLAMGRKDPLPLKEMSLNFVAVDRQGRVGGAGSDAGFQYSVTTRESSHVFDAVTVEE
jgi:N4-(beta-N-acetylglucosaminyl)-L-asparaginase